MDRTDENPFEGEGNGKYQLQIGVGTKELRDCTHEWNGKRYPGLECGELGGSNNCIWLGFWCRDKLSKECPALGAGVLTNNPDLCKEYKLWQGKPCNEDEIRCRAAISGQCVKRPWWGVEGKTYSDGRDASCKDGSDLYRPIVRAEETDQQDQPPQGQVWKTRPLEEWEYNRHIQPKGEEAKFRKDVSTGLWMIAVSEETCKVIDGFVCKVRLDVGDMTSHMMMMIMMV